ncbi:hypothetical protein FBEOM_2067 [Fusarium beomiforme]|uniref:Ubiquinol-cytochrome-c reductase cytochrome c1 n=1 Tax=Fusarium beomiforme TaxID=44412 RepID=A0A9P5E264_9HYPO|nr:hypothetical protein FBEOM_2067 [Fusarium beomiforme]
MRDQLETEATKNEEVVLQNVIETRSSEVPEVPRPADSEESSPESTAINTPADNPSLFPVYLPFPVEHKLMKALQKSLEVVCYEFGQETFPSILRDRGWDCPELVELNDWTGILSREGLLKGTNTPKSLNDFLRSIANIRHTAVHRLRTNSIGLETFLADAGAFAEILSRDGAQVGVISKLRSDTGAAISELRQNKQFLQLQLERTLLDIEQQRAELDRREQEAINHMREEDKRYQEIAGERLREGLVLIEELDTTVHVGNRIVEDANSLDGVDSTSIEGEEDEDEDAFEDCIE